MGASYRKLGSIGWIVPPRCNETVIEEVVRVRPPGLAWCFASLAMDRFGRSNFDDALDAVRMVAGQLEERGVDLIVYTGMPLTASRGAGFHTDLAAEIGRSLNKPLPVTTDTAIVLHALDKLDARRLSIITPYKDDTVQQVREVFAGAGQEVVDAVGCGWSLAEFITEPDDDTSYEVALRSFEQHPDTDAFYLSCPQWPVVGNIARIEQATGKPVVTQAQAIVWWALGQLGVTADITGFGRLFEQDPR